MRGRTPFPKGIKGGLETPQGQLWLSRVTALLDEGSKMGYCSIAAFASYEGVPRKSVVKYSYEASELAMGLSEGLKWQIRKALEVGDAD